MRLTAEKLNIKRNTGQGFGGGRIMSGWMYHHSYINAAKGPSLSHDYFASVKLLCRSADNHNAATQAVSSRFSRYSGANSTGSYQIVATSVAQYGQGIVFRQNGNSRSAIPITGLKSGRQPADAPFDGETIGLQIFGQPGSRLLLVKTRLRVGMYLKAQGGQLLPLSFNSFFSQ